jgi:hypothetical protein
MSEFNGPDITKKRGGLGRRSPSTDGVCGLICGGVAVAGKIALGEIKKLIQVSDAEDLGINAAYDSTNEILVYQHIKNFFRYNPNGTLYLMLVTRKAAATGVSMTDMCDTANDHLKKLLTYEEEGVKVIRNAGVVLNPDLATYVSTLTSGLDGDVVTAIPKAQELVEGLRAQQIYVDNIMLEGREANGTIATMLDLRAQASEYVSVVIAADPAVQALDVSYAKYADVGSALGMLSVRKVNECLGSVDIANKPDAKKGSENYSLTDKVNGVYLSAAISSGVLYKDLTAAEKTSLEQKGYIYAGSYEGYQGVYFNDSHTCIEVADDYAYIEDNRVWNKAVRYLRKALMPIMKGNVDIDPATGYISSSTIAFFEQKAQKEVGKMATDGEISGQPEIYIDPKQDVVSASKVLLSLSYIRKGVLRKLEANVGATNPFNA